MRLILRISIIVFLLLSLITIFLLYDRSPSEGYSGNLENGLPHGFGTWKNSNGVSYTGYFYEGLRHGRGIWAHPDGIKYAGEWQQGIYHGRGTLILPSGARYDGQWFEGKKHGPGIYRWPDGRIYIGFWVNDRFNGYGLYTNADGFTYKGEWLDDRKHGEGSATYPDGSKYYGQWLNDMRHGHGNMIYPDGSVYEGGWSEDVKHGEGSTTDCDGTINTFVWTNDRLQEVPVSAITINPSTINLIAGGTTATLVAKIFPEEATNHKLIWATNNPIVARVNDDGIVSPVNPGKALITATTIDGNYTAVCNVTVSTALGSVTGVSLDRTSITIRVGETATLRATVLPTNATNSNVYWATSNSSVADVYQKDGWRGEVRAYNPGEIWITVTTVEGNHTARCQVTILEKEDQANKVIVPRLIGKLLPEAKNMIADAELAIGEISFEFHESIPFDQVISQNPAIGASVNKGSAVRLIISKGPEYEIEIESEPDLDSAPID